MEQKFNELLEMVPSQGCGKAIRKLFDSKPQFAKPQIKNNFRFFDRMKRLKGNFFGSFPGESTLSRRFFLPTLFVGGLFVGTALSEVGQNFLFWRRDLRQEWIDQWKLKPESERDLLWIQLENLHRAIQKREKAINETREPPLRFSLFVKAFSEFELWEGRVAEAHLAIEREDDSRILLMRVGLESDKQTYEWKISHALFIEKRELEAERLTRVDFAPFSSALARSKF